MAEAFVKGLVVALFLGFISLIRYFINWLRYRNREKLREEDEKHSFLENKFKNLLNSKDGKKEIINITISQPLRSNKPWVVYKTLKWGTWPLNNKEEDEIHFTISDNELSNMEDYIKYKNSIGNNKSDDLSSNNFLDKSIDNTWNNN
jgi:hypothetical protein